MQRTEHPTWQCQQPFNQPCKHIHTTPHLAMSTTCQSTLQTHPHNTPPGNVNNLSINLANTSTQHPTWQCQQPYNQPCKHIHITPHLAMSTTLQTHQLDCQTCPKSQFTTPCWRHRNDTFTHHQASHTQISATVIPSKSQCCPYSNYTQAIPECCPYSNYTQAIPECCPYSNYTQAIPECCPYSNYTQAIPECCPYSN